MLQSNRVSKVQAKVTAWGGGAAVLFYSATELDAAFPIIAQSNFPFSLSFFMPSLKLLYDLQLYVPRAIAQDILAALLTDLLKSFLCLSAAGNGHTSA